MRRIYDGDEKERRRKAALASYYRNREERLAKHKEWYENYRLEIREQRKEQRKEKMSNSEYRKKENEKRLAYYHKNKAGISQRRKELWQEKMKNPEFKQRERERGLEKFRQLRLKVFEIFGLKCSNCGFDNPICLELHHRTPVKHKYGEPSWTCTQLRELLRMNPEEARQKHDLVCCNCHKLKYHTNGNRTYT